MAPRDRLALNIGSGRAPGLAPLGRMSHLKLGRRARGSTPVSFTRQDVPDQTGKLIVVTGANSGTGFETAKALAGRGAEVVLAARNPAKAEAALQAIRTDHPHAQLRFEPLDLVSLRSVHDFADRMLAQGRPIDGLVNNAGVMALTERQVSEDGFELQLATNYLAISP